VARLESAVRHARQQWLKEEAERLSLPSLLNLETMSD
jgi:hypothetical protein